MAKALPLVLVDTSVFIDFFRGSDAPSVDRLVELISSDRVALCGLIEAEIRYGLRPSERDRVQSLLKGFQTLDTKEEDFHHAGDLGSRLRVRGVTIPLHDCLIAALAIRYRVPLLTTDEHFNQIESLTLLP